MILNIFMKFVLMINHMKLTCGLALPLASPFPSLTLGLGQLLVQTQKLGITTWDFGIYVSSVRSLMG